MAWTSKATDQGQRFYVEPGNYWMIVRKAQEKYSKNGNPMVELDLEVIGQNCMVQDNLMDPAAMPKAKWKSDTFALSAGLAAEVGADYTIDATQLPGVRVYAELMIESRDWEGKTYKSSKVARYVPVAEQPKDKPAVPVPPPVADVAQEPEPNIPF